VAILSSIAVYLNRAPLRFLPESDASPVASAAAIFLMVVACSAMLSALLRSRDRLEAERERYARLAESRDLLYREMQHRVSNNIQIVAGLLHLQSQGLQDPGAKRALTEASSRISLIARIQRQLHDNAGEPMPFRLFAQELLADALAAAGVEGVSVEIEGGEEALHADQATPVSLVMLECVNNALEHAFDPGQTGVVRVTLARDGARHVLTVSDDGRGLPGGFDLEAGKSLGLKIVRTMASQLEGDFSIKPRHPGALCTLRFPDLG
jgi:two-component sensor histidine kinase